MIENLSFSGPREAPGRLRGGSRWFWESPEGSREAPGGSGDAPGRLQEAPGREKEVPVGANSPRWAEDFRPLNE